MLIHAFLGWLLDAIIKAYVRLFGSAEAVDALMELLNEEDVSCAPMG